MQIKIGAGKLDMGLEDFAGSLCMEDQQGSARQAISTLVPQFAPELAAPRGVREG